MDYYYLLIQDPYSPHRAVDPGAEDSACLCPSSLHTSSQLLSVCRVWTGGR